MRGERPTIGFGLFKTHSLGALHPLNDLLVQSALDILRLVN